MITRGQVEAAAGRLLDTFTITGWHQGHHGVPIMRAVTTNHGEVIVKVHRNPQRHNQEIHAYRNWTAALGDLAPRLIAECPTPPAIAITAVVGLPLSQQTLTPQQERDVYAQAGQLLRRLHAAAPNKRDPSFCTFLAARGEHWLAQAGTRLTPGHRTEIRAKLRKLACLPTITLMPCHLDFMPRNLIRARGGTVRLIDFEHARYDLPTRDLVRLSTRVFPARPDLRDAFLNGYGPLTNLDEQIIDCCAGIDQASLAAQGTGSSPANFTTPVPKASDSA
jgi:Ser/Thr protein kinase RdoA (MazF antagonist)